MSCAASFLFIVSGAIKKPHPVTTGFGLALLIVYCAVSISLMVTGIILACLESEPIPLDKISFGVSQTPVNHDRMWIANILLGGIGMLLSLSLLQCICFNICAVEDSTIVFSLADSNEV